MIFVALRQYGSDIAGKILKDQIRRESHGVYELDFESLDISLFNQNLFIYNLHLFQTKEQATDTSTTAYELIIPEISIYLEGISDIYFGKELIIEGIKVVDPEVILTKNGNIKKKSTFSLETGTMYRVINSYLSVFGIKDFAMNNAKFQYTDNQSDQLIQLGLDQVDFSISNFLIDSLSNQNLKFLNTDKIELVITNQSYLFSDSIHQISFDQFHLSTSTGDISFKNINLSPKSDIDISSLKNYFNIIIPQFNISGLDFDRAYTKNELFIDSIRIFNPIIEIEDNTIKKTDTTRNIDPASSLTDVFSKIKIKQLYLDNAFVDIKNTSAKNANEYQSDNVNIHLIDLQIDSALYFSNSWYEMLQDIEFDAKNFFSYLIDSTHTIQAQTLHYSSKDAQLYGKGINLTPLPNAESIEMNIDGYIDSLFIDQLSRPKQLISGEIDANNFRIIDSDIKIRMIKSPETKSGTTINQIHFSHFSIQNGDLEFRSPNIDNLVLNGGNYELEELIWNNELKESFSFHGLSAKNTINLNKLIFKKNQLQLKGNEISLHNWRDFSIENTYLDLPQQPTPMKARKIYLRNFDIDHFFRHELLAFDTLVISEPIIELHPNESPSNLTRKDLSIWAHHTVFREVKIKNGLLTHYDKKGIDAHLENFDIELSKFHYDSIKDEYYSLIGYRSDSIFFQLKNINHTLTGKDLDINIKDSTLDVKHLHLQPKNKKLNKLFYVNTHEFKLRQIDFHRLINEGQLHFNNGYLLSPNIDIRHKSINSNKKDFEKNLLKFNSLNISNGKLKIQNLHEDDFSITQIKHLDALISQFDLGQDSSIFSAKNYLTDIRGFSHYSQNLEDTITVAHAFVNTKYGDASINNMHLKPNKNIDITIPKLNIQGLDPKILADENRYAIDSISIDYIQITQVFDSSATKKQAHFPNLELGLLKVNGAHYVFTKEGFNHDFPLNISDINLKSRNIVMHSDDSIFHLESQLNRTFLESGKISFTTKDSLYDLSTAGVIFDGEKNQVSFKNLKLKPLYSRSKFQNQIEYQQDWLDLKIPVLIIRYPQLEDFFEGKININKVSILHSQLDTHRDKRLPLPPDSKKPLPQQLISNLDFDLQIDTISIKEAFISHSEFSEEGLLPGSIFFKNINGNIMHVSNVDSLLQTTPFMIFEASGTMMNTGKFEVIADFDMTDSSQFFYMEGNLKDMDLTELNRLLEHTAYVHVRDGYNKNVDFSFEANDRYAIGDMKFYYEDLKIKVLNPDDQSDKGHGAAIKSFFANTFVVNSKNPHFLIVRHGDIFHQRDPNKAIFNYWAKALLSGVVSSIGAKNNKKEIKKLNEQLKIDLDNKKAETLKRLGLDEKH